MTPEPSNEYQKLVEALEERIAKQRERGGDMLTYGTPDPLDVALLAALSALKLPHAGDAMSEQNVQVTQADRDAARELSLVWVREGALGEFDIAQAFARHRTRAEPDLVEAATAALPHVVSEEHWINLANALGFDTRDKCIHGSALEDDCGECAALTRADV